MQLSICLLLSRLRKSTSVPQFPTLPLQYSEIQFGGMPYQFRIWWLHERFNSPPKCLLYDFVQQTIAHHPSSTNISNQHDLMLAVNTPSPQRKALRMVVMTGPKGSLLSVYSSISLQPLWRMSACPKWSLLYSGHAKMPHRWWLCTRITPL